MAFVNLPPALQDMFYSLSDRIAKLETGPSTAMTYATSAQGTASQAILEAEEALAEAQQAYILGSQAIIKDAYTITNSSNNLTGINGNGITVYAGASSSSGARVVLNSAGLVGYNSSNSPTFSINASNGAVSTTGAIFTDSSISGGSLNINGNAIINSSGYLTATGATVTGTITSTAGTIGGWTITSNALTSGSSRIDSSNGNAAFSGNLSAINYDGTGYIFTGGTISNSGQINSGQSMTSGSAVFATTNLYTQGHSTIANAANCFIQSAAGSNYGRLYRSTASSERYKHDIVDITDVPELDPTALYDLPVRAFRFNEGYVESTDDRAEVLIPGFIAEEVDAIYPAAADYAGGQVETWNDRMLIPAMLKLIQQQNDRITELESRL